MRRLKLPKGAPRPLHSLPPANFTISPRCLVAADVLRSRSVVLHSDRRQPTSHFILSAGGVGRDYLLAQLTINGQGGSQHRCVQHSRELMVQQYPSAEHRNTANLAPHCHPHPILNRQAPMTLWWTLASQRS